MGCSRDTLLMGLIKAPCLCAVLASHMMVATMHRCFCILTITSKTLFLYTINILYNINIIIFIQIYITELTSVTAPAEPHFRDRRGWEEGCVISLFLAAVGLHGCAWTLAAASGGYPPAEVSGFSLRRLLLLQSTGSRRRWRQQWWGTSSVAPRDVGSSRTSDQTHIIGRQTQPPDHQGSRVPDDKGSDFSALPQLFFQGAPFPLLPPELALRAEGSWHGLTAVRGPTIP